MAHEPVFISHATLDNDFAMRLYDALESADIDAWIDDNRDDIPVGTEWDGDIQKAIHAHDYCVFVLSPNSAQNGNCKAEWWHFLNRTNKRLYVVLKEPVSIEIFPWRLVIEQYVDLSTNFESGLETLIHAIADRRAMREGEIGVHVKQYISGRIPYYHFDIAISGRDKELTEIKTLLLEENTRLLVLYGNCF